MRDEPFPAPDPERSAIDERLVTALIGDQFPHWASLPVRRTEPGGWDNRTFHLGNEFVVRMPSARCYSPQVLKERRWLPVLAERLPLPVPRQLALGEPGHGYPFHWSVNAWIPGERAEPDRVADLGALAADVAAFLTALASVDTDGAPRAGPETFFRGASLRHYDGETRAAIAGLAGEVPSRVLTEVWEAALDAVWDGPAVWFHGDVTPDNLLVRDGRLAAVIDFGCSAVGDPACDLAIAWTTFSGSSRRTLRRETGADEGMWARGRGWALWKALIVRANPRRLAEWEAASRTLDEVVAEFRTGQ